MGRRRRAAVGRPDERARRRSLDGPAERRATSPAKLRRPRDLWQRGSWFDRTKPVDPATQLILPLAEEIASLRATLAIAAPDDARTQQRVGAELDRLRGLWRRQPDLFDPP